MYIDGDTHYFPIRMLERVSDPGKGYVEVSGDMASYSRNGELVRSFREPRWDLEKRYAWMDRDGFDVQVLIPDNPQLTYDLDPALGVPFARAYNDTVAEEVGKHGRFVGVAWVYLPDVEEAVWQLRRASEELGLHAVKVMGKFGDTNLDSQALWPFYEEAARLDIPILVHPVAALGNELIRPLFESNGIKVGPWGAQEFRRSPRTFSGGLGLPFLYMAITTRLVFSGTLDRFPALRFGFFEGGRGVGALPDELDG